MSQELQPSTFQERVAQVRTSLVERLRFLRPCPRTYATAFCVGATIGEYAALAGSTDPAAVLAAVTALGVNLLADIIGDRESPPGLTPDEIAEAVQERLGQGDDLPAVRTLLQEFGTLQLALETWRQAEDERFQRLIDELSTHPQLIAVQVTQDVVETPDPRFVSLERRLETLRHLFTQSWLEAPPAPLSRAAMDALVREYAAEVQHRYRLWRDRYVALAGELQVPSEQPASRPVDPFQPREFEHLWYFSLVLASESRVPF